LGGAELFEEAVAVLVEQSFEAVCGGGLEDETGVVMLGKAVDDFGSVEGGGVGLFLAGEADDAAGVILPELWKEVLLSEKGGDFDAGPLDPRVDAGGEFDDVGDEGSTDACGGFEEVEGSGGFGFDELGMGDAGDEAEGVDDLPVNSDEVAGVVGVTVEGAGAEDSSLMHGLHRRLAVLVGRGEEDLAVPGDAFDVEDLARDEALE
jgi:hypothetical protein